MYVVSDRLITDLYFCKLPLSLLYIILTYIHIIIILNVLHSLFLSKVVTDVQFVSLGGEEALAYPCVTKCVHTRYIRT